MNQHLQNILNRIQQDETLSADEKNSIAKSLKDADKEIEINAFKLDRTEKVKRTTAILLEETIAELEQKRKAVEAQNRELEIESSLERVRTVAMAMRKPDDMLDVCRMISDQLQLLRFKEIRNIQTVIIYEPKHEYLNYQYFTPYDKNSIELIDYTLHPDVLEFAELMLQSADAYYTKTFEGEALQVWRDYRKQTSQLPDPKLDEVTSSHYYFYSIGSGALGVTTYAPLTEDQIILFKRFRNVFQLAYSRFIDIQKAEAQAREANIEAALERVRSRSMAMHNTSELQEVIHTVHKELLHLNVSIDGGSFITINKDIDTELRCWGSGGTADTSEEVHVPLYQKPFCANLINAIKKGPGFFTEKFTQKEKKEFFTFLFKHKPWSDLDEKQKNETLSSPGGYTRSCCVSEHTSIFIINHSGREFSQSENDILQRFGKVFEQTYTRFLDLQKAEAQAREAQIELGLERVRARAMAMQNSNELAELVSTVFKELTQLNFLLTSCIIWINNPEQANDVLWVSNSEMNQPAEPYFLKPFHHSFFKSIIQAWKIKDPKWFFTLTGEDKRSFQEAFFNEIPNLPDTFRRALLVPDKVVFSASFNNFGALEVVATEPLSDENFNILHRFGKVFDSSYTRFNDLKKAEAQAREAKIEAALERVRSKAMAMHRSEDLNLAVAVVFDELENLGLGMVRCGIGILNKEKRTTNLFTTSKSDKGTTVQLTGDESMDLHPLQRGSFNAWLNGEDFSYVLKGKEIEEFYRSGANTNFNLPDSQRLFSVDEGTEQYYHVSMFQCGGLYAFRDSEFPGEAKRIMKRFAGVFNLTYNRFLDLQKAEAQAREAQVQLALERVRAKTMAMQKSEELPETSKILFEQMKELGEPAEQLSIGIMREENNVVEISATLQGDTLKQIYRHSIDEPHMMRKIYEAWKAQQKTVVVELKGEELNAYNRYRNELTHSEIFSTDLGDESRRIVYAAFFSRGMLAIATNEPRPPGSLQLLERFASVFDLTYTRFLDLQKAEAQAREAKIEAALERVRARTMAMQKSDELSETAAVLFHQFKELGEDPLQITIGTLNEAEGTVENRVTDWGDSGSRVNRSFILSLEEPALISKQFKAWKENKSSIVIDLTGKELENWINYRNKIYGIPVRPEDIKGRRVVSSAFFSSGMLSISTPEPPSQETIQLLERFANVFNLTYNRFLDLQKAEAQAREAKIEAALERVRSRAMAMQNSSELNSLVGTVFTELTKLDLVLTRSVIIIFEPDTNAGRWWMANSEAPSQPMNFLVKYHDLPFFNAYLKGWKERNAKWVFELEGKDKIEVDNYLFTETELSLLPGFVIEGMKAPGRVWLSSCFNNFGCLTLASLEPLPDEHFDILIRFAKVFDLTYTRFNDLKQAEAQAREAKIEAALERVRARAMAMQKSGDLADAVAIVFEELDKLNLGMLRCGIGILNKEKRSADVWTTTKSDNDTVVHVSGDESMDIHPLLHGAFDAWLKQVDYSYVLKGDDLNDYYKALTGVNFRLPDSQSLVSEEGVEQYYFNAIFSSGGLFAFGETEFSEEAKRVMKRFAGVFNLTYNRFLDLQKAEAQAREATIEAALERVRGKALAMHNSNDLSSTASMVFTELRKLGITPLRCGVGLLNKESRRGQLYSATSSADGDSLALVGWVELSGHPVLENIYDTWIRNEDYFPELSGEQLRSYYDLLLQGLSVKVPDWQDGQKQYGSFLPFAVGCLYAWSENPYNETEIKILKRFATIIDLTFRRYMDLQRSEASAKQAIKQAALDRIRADIASMRTITDLERITPLIWNELTILDVPFIRCGIFIMDDSQKLIHTFLSTPDGRAIAAFHLPYSTRGNITQVLEHWQDKKIYVDHWDESAFTEFADILVEQGGLASAEQYLKTIPQGGFYLHFLPFLQGMLYVGNSTQLDEEEIKLVQSVADAFSTAYSRYEDFNKLEAAKKQVDSALDELQVTQKQLIQSEKMASLGELTAGIAHEIQNPLNFVNNFSEVNKELLAEMVEEIKKGNYDAVKELANHVEENQEKINHHGKRAEAIVKGMLQHSRSSSGVKEPTDINKLADEYLRLAYHGLRAKDKSFNASLKTDYDPGIGTVNIIPQEVGRVILNLITNAFYAVTAKKKQQADNLPAGQAGYEPTVSISTKKSGDKVLISVKDNGNGIPQKIIDKIFQPFFTTKPTGQGTGLGLSLSYDIIKAHGGEIKVETKEARPDDAVGRGEGTEFIICIPAN